MKTFPLELNDSSQTQLFEQITQCICADASGSFGILAGHIPMVAILRYGLVRFQEQGGNWRYAALPGGILRFADNRLTITSIHCFLGNNRDALVQQLTKAMETEDSDIHSARRTLAQIEESLIRRLSEIANPAVEEL